MSNAPPVEQKPKDDEKELKPQTIKSPGSGIDDLLSLRIDAEAVKPPSEQKTAQYWCGVTDECPFQTVHAGGIDFPKFIQIQAPDPNNPNRLNLTDARQHGRLHWLTDEQVKKALDSIKHRVVRSVGQRSYMMSILGSNSHPYAPREGDFPIGTVVYMVKLRKNQHVPRDAPHNQPLVR